jgi:hypothetical protein
VDVVQEVGRTAEIGPDPVRFIFWLVLMLAVLGITGRIVYAAWKSGRDSQRDDRESESASSGRDD